MTGVFVVAREVGPSYGSLRAYFDASVGGHLEGIESSLTDKLMAALLNTCPGLRVYEETALRLPEKVYRETLLRPAVQAALQQRQIDVALFVERNFNSSLHLPLYFLPVGVALGHNNTNMKAELFDARSGKLHGTVTTQADGEFSVFGWGLTFFVDPETEESAMNALLTQLKRVMCNTSDTVGNGTTPHAP